MSRNRLALEDIMKEKPEGFSNSEVKHQLLKLSEMAHELSQNLSNDGGIPLTPAEKEVLRMAKLQLVTIRMAEIKYFLVMGSTDDALCLLSFLQDVVRAGW